MPEVSIIATEAVGIGFTVIVAAAVPEQFPALVTVTV
jgi:hypothetical protein